MDAPTADVTLPATSLRSKDLLGIAELTPEEILLVLDTAEAMKEISQRQIKKVPALRGRTVVNLFYEPSTRTRTSFEIAEKRLSADTLGGQCVLHGDPSPARRGRFAGGFSQGTMRRT